jgi:hypothetical protein
VLGANGLGIVSKDDTVAGTGAGVEVAAGDVVDGTLKLKFSG